MGSRLDLHPTLKQNVFCYTPEISPIELWENGGLLIVDDVEWVADFNVLRSGLVRRKRAFKESFIDRQVAPEVEAELAKLYAQASEIFAALYPGFIPREQRNSWRPMISGPEPIHFDTYADPLSFVTSFTNVSDEPRVYHVSHNFPELVKHAPNEVRRALSAVKHDVDDLSYSLRSMLVAGSPPFDQMHKVSFAPGAIWFFNPKIVSHQVVYGSGAASSSWPITNSRARSQLDYLREAGIA